MSAAYAGPGERRRRRRRQYLQRLNGPRHQHMARALRASKAAKSPLVLYAEALRHLTRLVISRVRAHIGRTIARNDEAALKICGVDIGRCACGEARRMRGEVMVRNNRHSGPLCAQPA